MLLCYSVFLWSPFDTHMQPVGSHAFRRPREVIQSPFFILDSECLFNWSFSVMLRTRKLSVPSAPLPLFFSLRPQPAPLSSTHLRPSFSISLSVPMLLPCLRLSLPLFAFNSWGQPGPPGSYPRMLSRLMSCGVAFWTEQAIEPGAPSALKLITRV